MIYLGGLANPRQQIDTIARCTMRLWVGKCINHFIRDDPSRMLASNLGETKDNEELEMQKQQ